MIEHAAHALQQLVDTHGLGEESIVRTVGAVETIFAVARDIDDSQLRPDGPQTCSQLGPAHSRHDDVSQHELERAGVLLAHAAFK